MAAFISFIYLFVCVFLPFTWEIYFGIWRVYGVLFMRYNCSVHSALTDCIDTSYVMSQLKFPSFVSDCLSPYLVGIADIFDCIKSTKLSTHMKNLFFFWSAEYAALYALKFGWCDCVVWCIQRVKTYVRVCVCASESICQKIYVDFNGRNQRHRKKLLWTLEVTNASLSCSLTLCDWMELKPFECVCHHIFWQGITSSSSSK